MRGDPVHVILRVVDGLLVDRPLESAVVDEAHLGDIEGALGSLRWRQLQSPRTVRRRFRALAAIAGPGLLALVADNDAGGVATYAQAGQEQGTRLLWVLVLLAPVLVVNQEMAARLGAVTGVGHARLILERFGRFWGAFSLGDLLVLNALTLITEFIGIRLAAEYLGVNPAVAVPGAALLLLWASVSGSFRHWERVMYALIAVDIAAVPLLFAAHPTGPAVATDVLLPGVRGAAAPAIVLVIALAGTTIAPWQLFFQQSVVVDKRITPRWLGYERLDTVIGAVVMLIGAAVVMLVVAGSLGETGRGGFADAGVIASGLSDRLGRGAGGLFALLILDGAILGAAAVTLTTSYAIGDVTGARHSLHRTPNDAPAFYLSFAALLAGAAVVALLPGIPLGFITTAVQVLAGLLLPTATICLLLLSNDDAVLGPWVNGRWLNALASLIVATLLLLSVLLVVTTLFPAVSVAALASALGAVALVGWTVVVVAIISRPPSSTRAFAQSGAPSWWRFIVMPPASHVVTVGRRGRRLSERDRERRSWRMPRLDELRRPTWSRARIAGMVMLRAYLLVGVALLVGRLLVRALN